MISNTGPRKKLEIIKPQDKFSGKRWALRSFLILSGVAALGIISFAGLFFFYSQDPDLPRLNSIRDYQPKTVTRIFDRHGLLVGEIFSECRTVVPIERIPKLLIRAVVASEDAQFFRHRGLDYTGMLRAFFANLRAGRYAQGGSTITQQVVKTFFLSPARTIKRKMQEVILARRLESELRKEEILYLYLNQIYFGHGRYGVQEASRFYFNKDVDRLQLGEMALLAGLPQSPERLSPVKHPERAKQRQIYVLNQMAKHKLISYADAQRVATEPIRTHRYQQEYLHQAPEFVDQVRRDLLKTFGVKKLWTMGMKVQSTIDVKLQMASRRAVQEGLRQLDQRQGFHRAVMHLKGKSLGRWRKRLAREQKNIKEGKLYRAIILEINDKEGQLKILLGAEEGYVDLPPNDRYNPLNLRPSKRFKIGDLIEVRAEEDHFLFDRGPQAALVAMEPETGEVIAMIGGYTFSPGGFNRATLSHRQPGSAFKPFVYAAALDSGKYTAATIVDDAPVVIGGWNPQNYDGTFRGPIRLRLALAHSINTIAAKLIDDVGVERVRELAKKMGLSTPLGNDLSLALGTSEVIPLDLTKAYCAIANGGKRIEPIYIQKMGEQVLNRPKPEQVLKPEVSFILTSLMQSVVQEGTARYALRLRRPVAGKTGTTNNLYDAWFVGFSPQMVVAVWVGFDEPRRLGRQETGGRAALPIWVNFMEQALKSLPRLPFHQPSGIVVQKIDPLTGLLAPEGATDAVEEYFIAGTEPQEVAPQTDQVNPDTILMNPDVPETPPEGEAAPSPEVAPVPVPEAPDAPQVN
jgi:penicillin-binding protein 1A